MQTYLRFTLPGLNAPVQQLVFAKRLVRIAVQPALAWLRRSDHRVPGLPSVLTRMMVRRTVATKGHAAFLARAQVNPVTADLDALGTFANLRLLDGIDGIEMTTTAIGHNYFLLLVEARRMWIPATAIPPSPTAAAHRFTDPERTSPAAKIPGRLVSIGVG